MTIVIRTYAVSLQESWLRCRALAYMRSQFTDEIDGDRPQMPLKRGVALVACVGHQVVGIADTVCCAPNADQNRRYRLTAGTPLAILDTLAVHPDYQRQGIATQLLNRTRQLLANRGGQLLIYTRDDAAANTFYRRQGANLLYTSYIVTGNSPRNLVPAWTTFQVTVSGQLQLFDATGNAIDYGTDLTQYEVGDSANLPQLTDRQRVVTEHVYLLALD